MNIGFRVVGSPELIKRVGQPYQIGDLDRRYQKFILLTCLLLMVMDGYDIQAIAYAAPLIMEHWHIDKTMLGVVFSASLFGLFIGSLFLSSLADRFGRRPILLISTLAFSVLMLLTPSVSSVEQLTIIRFVTGIFLGGIMPNVMAYSSEIVPSKYRILTMMVISCGYTVGAMLGGGISALLTPIGGWHAIFYFANWLPMLAKESGLNLNQALLIGSILQLGGAFGSILMGLKIDKVGFYKGLQLLVVSQRSMRFLLVIILFHYVLLGWDGVLE
ncbi:unnamed protein product [Oppiella nova]|uniref:Major facilitator superfamily (MFS) profile domain-containing protein n=1 Tax=Oppiella nova TaxID=334625 RepID=A0A7R9L8D6_9ACAR|nr:unnamed protein product [Oppiella nova]CAG2158180.1 unnamed protein product [Oppiella nova]